MTARAIIIAAPMVRALIDGRKTQTRRLVGGVPDMPPANCHPSHKAKHAAPYLDAYYGEPKTPSNPRGMGRNWHWWQVDDRPGPTAFRLPYATGDRLYVLEAFQGHSAYEAHGYKPSDWGNKPIWYCADGEPDPLYSASSRKRPSIHMPRWASRLTLTVTEVRVQRLQDISEADAVAEGCLMDPEPCDDGSHFPAEIAHERGGDIGWDCARDWFADLWNTIYGPEAWDVNPWVVAISFTVAHGNIDGLTS